MYELRFFRSTSGYNRIKTHESHYIGIILYMDIFLRNWFDLQNLVYDQLISSLYIRHSTSTG